MPKVHILPPEVVSKIAAGEVIERPASVVKELLENALDAKATSLEIHLKDAGKRLIYIKDNGYGIEVDDLDNIFNRHATSKIENADDLESILSLGFRGEALFSIAAISDATLKSKTRDAEEGWEIHLRGGQKLTKRPAPLSTGTEIEIKELFFNTPARRKFLKSNITEINQVLNLVIPYTFLYPQTRFLLTHQDKELLDLRPNENLILRIAYTLNLEEKNILSYKQSFPEKNLSVNMVLGDINIKRTRRDMQFIFVNGRPVQNKNISFHMNQIYRLILPPEFYPFFAVFINIAPQDVDVNIHPAKREVKIRDEQHLCSTLRTMCEKALMGAGPIKQVTMSQGHHVTSKNLAEKALLGANALETAFEASRPTELFESAPRGTSTKDFSFPKSRYGTEEPGQPPEFFIPENSIFEQKQSTLQHKLKNARYIGSFINKFIIFESGGSLLFIDQHAAQERIAYEQFIVQMNNNTIEVQHLLSPITIKLTIQEILAWEEAKEKLTAIGLETSQFGKETIAVHTQPVLLKDVEGSVRDLLAGESIVHCDHDTIARRACRCSIMAGDKLSKEEAEHQRQELIKCLDPFTCPHGRPTVIELTESFLDKQFLRT